MKRSAALALLAASACARREPPPQATPAPPPVVSLAPAAVAPSDAAAPSPVAVAPPAPAAPKGTATFVMQRIESVCIAGVGALVPGTIPVGTDLLVETSDGESGKPAREFASCPKGEGGTAPKLGMCRACKTYGACKVLTTDAAADRVEVQCGKDHVVLEVNGGRTMLRGPFGEREIAPFPMKLAPPKKDVRRCDVTC